MIARLIVLFSVMIWCREAVAQDRGYQMTLQDVVAMAGERSSSFLQASNLKENKYWDWRAHQSNYRPQLSLNGTLPDYTKSFIPASQPDGNILFQPVNFNNSHLVLSLSQAVSLTGGEVFVYSSLQRYDDFETDFTQFSGSPLAVGLLQPLFAYNKRSWDRKIEPLLFEESKKQYPENIQLISLQATQLFFDLRLAQTQLEVAQKNLSSTDTLLSISQVRYDLGRISEGDLLQLKLSRINSRKAVSSSRVAKDMALLELRSYLNLIDSIGIRLVLPEIIPDFNVDLEMALLQARKNSPTAIAFERRVIEAKRDVAQAKGENGISAELYASVGLTNAATAAEDIYRDSQQLQSFRMGFSVPILDWGRAASKIKSAKANQSMTKNIVAQEEANFIQEVYTLVRQFKMRREQITDTKEADEIALRRYEISKERYIIGDYNITELNIAQSEKDSAKIDYILSLRDFWLAYYQLRVVTLYNFEREETLLYIE